MSNETGQQHEQSRMLTREQHEQVAVLAYDLWTAAGRPEGVREDGSTWADYFWVKAEQTLLGTHQVVTSG